jgi:hypothetical protein
MFTTGSKWFLGLGIVSIVLAVAYGWTTGGTGLGPVTVGYNGGVGEHLGYALLVTIGLTGIFLGVITTAARDADATALAGIAGTDEAPAAVPPADVAYWPIVGAFAASMVVLGLVISNAMFIGGLMLLLVVLVEWMVLAWSDRATGDPAVNRVVRRRIMGPYEVPLAGSAGAVLAVFAFSRLFLTASKLGAVWVATGAGTVVFVVGAVIASRPRVTRNAIAGLLLVAGAGVATAGIVAAARGERTIHPHHGEEERTESGSDAEPGQLTPFVPQGTNRATTTTTEAEG